MYHQVVPAGGRSGAAWARMLSRSVASALAAVIALGAGGLIVAAAPAATSHGHSPHGVAAAVHGAPAGPESHEDRNTNGRGRRDHDDRTASGGAAVVVTTGGAAAGVLAATATAPGASAFATARRVSQHGTARVGATPAPPWPDVLLVPPSTLPKPVTIVPASTEGLGATFVLAAGAAAVLVIGTLLGVRLARRPT